MSSDKVASFIHDLCRMDRFGGRCRRVDQGRWEVDDIERWDENHYTALHHRFPTISACVVANRKSLSGFTVVLRHQTASHLWTSALICTVMLAVMAAVVKVGRSSHW
jgi:hypothetical protein